MPFLQQWLISHLNCHFKVQNDGISTNFDSQASLIEVCIYLVTMISDDLLLKECEARRLFRIVWWLQNPKAKESWTLPLNLLYFCSKENLSYSEIGSVTFLQDTFLLLTALYCGKIFYTSNLNHFYSSKCSFITLQFKNNMLLSSVCDHCGHED